MNRLLIILAVLYILMPLDLLPDFIPVRGWIDDIVIAGLLLYRFFQNRKTRPAGRPSSGSGPGDSDNRSAGPQPADRQPCPPPHQVLEVAPDATASQIKAAYRRLAAKYHPDKFTHLDDQFRRLAEERFKQIQAAYQEMTAAAEKR